MVFDEILDLYGDDLPSALKAYSKKRNPDAEAIVDLAMYNYVEVRVCVCVCLPSLMYLPSYIYLIVFPQ